MKSVQDYARFKVRPFTGAMGAEISGVDLRDCPDDVFRDVMRALHEFHALAVRDQHLDTPTLQKVARRFGPFSGNPVHARRDANERRRGVLGDGNPRELARQGPVLELH